MHFDKAAIAELEKGDNAIRARLRSLGWKEQPWPAPSLEQRGEFSSRAYPIIACEKYHGMFDAQRRIAYFPSTSLCHDAACTDTHVEVVSAGRDSVVIDGKPADARAAQRVVAVLDAFRKQLRASVRFRISSKNTLSAPGKGLGTSASAGAALAHALVGACVPSLLDNKRFVGVLARRLAGSATRSAAGYASVWLSHPGIADEDCYAVSIGKPALRMLAVPVPSNVKTEAAHAEAPLSENFNAWALSKPAKAMRFIDAVQRGDNAALGALNEIDTLNLFNVTATAPSRLLYWEPVTLAVMKRVVELRADGLCAYFSIDTGPSVFVLTDAKSEQKVARGLRDAAGDYPVVAANVAPEPHEWHDAAL